MNNSNDHDEHMTDSRSETSRQEILHSRIRTEEQGEVILPVAENEISRICSELDAPESIETVAKAVYRRALKHDIIQNRTVAQITAASVYAASRVDETPYSLKAISGLSSASDRYISRTYSEISRELELKTGPTDPKDFVPRFCSELDLSEVVEQKATEILESTMETGIHTGRSPSGFAAASVYAASLLCNEKRTQREVADAADINVKTIRDGYQAQIEALGIH